MKEVCMCYVKIWPFFGILLGCLKYSFRVENDQELYLVQSLRNARAIVEPNLGIVVHEFIA